MLEHFVRDDLGGRVESRNVVEDPVKVVITNWPEDAGTEPVEVENNRNVPEMGTRTVPFWRELYIDGADFMEEPVKKYFRLYPGNEVRFKGAYYITCNEVVKNEDGSIKELLCTYDPATKGGDSPDGRKVKGTIHFVEASTAVPIRVRNYEHLYVTSEDGEQTLKFTVLPEDVAHVAFSTRIEYEGQFYEATTIRRYGNALGVFADVTAEHISYRLSRMEVETISLSGTKAEVLARIYQS